MFLHNNAGFNITEGASKMGRGEPCQEVWLGYVDIHKEVDLFTADVSRCGHMVETYGKISLKLGLAGC